MCFSDVSRIPPHAHQCCAEWAVSTVGPRTRRPDVTCARAPDLQSRANQSGAGCTVSTAGPRTPIPCVTSAHVQCHLPLSVLQSCVPCTVSMASRRTQTQDVTSAPVRNNLHPLSALPSCVTCSVSMDLRRTLRQAVIPVPVQRHQSRAKPSSAPTSAPWVAGRTTADVKPALARLSEVSTCLLCFLGTARRSRDNLMESCPCRRRVGGHPGPTAPNPPPLFLGPP